MRSVNSANAWRTWKDCLEGLREAITVRATGS